MLESDMYFCMIYLLFQVDEIFEVFSPFLLKDYPFLLRGVIKRYFRKRLVGQLHGQVRCCATATLLCTLKMLGSTSVPSVVMWLLCKALQRPGTWHSEER